MSDASFDPGDHPIDRLLAGDPPASADEEPLWATAAELHSALRPLPMDIAARAALKERLLAAPAVPRGVVRGKVRPWQVLVGRSSVLGSPVARAVLAAACVIVVAGLAYKAVATPPETSTPPRPVAVGMNPTPSPMPVLVLTPTATVAAQDTQPPVPTLPAVSSPTSRPPATATSAPAETSTQVPTPAPVATLPPVIVTPPGVTVVPPPSPAPTVPPSPTLPPTPPPAPTATVEVPFPTRGTALRTATPLPQPTRTPPTAVPTATATTRLAVTLVPTRPPATARPSSTPARHRAATIPSAVPSIAAPTPAPLHPRPTVPLVAAQPTATRAPAPPTQPIPPVVRLATAAVPTRVPEAPRATATPRPLLRAPATATASPAPPRATDVPPSPAPAGPVQAQVLVTPAPHLAQAGYAINSSPTPIAPPFVLVPYPRPLNAVLGSPLAIAQPLPIGADVLLSRTLPAALPTSASVANASAPVVGAGVALNLAAHLGPAFTSAATSTLKNQTGTDTPFSVVGPWNQGTYRLSVGAGQSSFLVKLTMVRQAAPLATNDSSLAHTDVSAQALWLLRKLGLAQDNLEPQYVSTAGSAEAQSVAFGQTIGGAMVLGHTSALVTLDGGGRLLSLQYAYLVTTGAQSYPLRGLVQAKADLEQGRGFYTGPTSVETGAPLVVRGIDLAYVAVQGTAGPGAVYLEPVYVFTGTVHRADGEPPFTAYVPALDPRAYAP